MSALKDWLKANPFEYAGAPEKPGDGFYVDREGRVRACRTGAPVEWPSDADIEMWAQELEKARAGMADRLGEYDAVDDADRRMEFVLVMMRPWRAPKPTPDSA